MERLGPVKIATSKRVSERDPAEPRFFPRSRFGLGKNAAGIAMRTSGVCKKRNFKTHASGYIKLGVCLELGAPKHTFKTRERGRHC